MLPQAQSKSVAATASAEFASTASDEPRRFDGVMAGALAPGFLELSCGPLTERLRRGEGALLAVNITWMAFAWPGWAAAGLFVGVSTLVLMTAYALNDWHDARGDRSDPKKNQRLVQGLIVRRQAFGVWLALLHVSLVAVAALGLGLGSAAAVAAMLGINAAYSWLLKGVPLADLFVVGLWGAAFVAIVGAPIWLCASVGLMTSIMHLFQIQQDRHVDAANKISTTVVRLPGAALSVLALICAGLAFTLLPKLGLLGAGSALIPLALYLRVKDTGKAWMACRVYCGLVLLAALGLFNGIG